MDSWFLLMTTVSSQTQFILLYLKKKLLPKFKCQYSTLLSCSWQNVILSLHPLPSNLRQSLLSEIYHVEIIWQELVICLKANSLIKTHANLKISPNFLLIPVILFCWFNVCSFGETGPVVSTVGQSVFKFVFNFLYIWSKGEIAKVIFPLCKNI